MKKTLFFDFFGVFVEETVSKYYQNHHFTKEQQEEGNKVFRQGDLGNILYPEVRKRLGAIDGTSPEDADKEFFRFSNANYDTIHAVEKLKEEGYKRYLLSNASTGHLRPLLEKYHLIPLFDRMFISAEVRRAKPDVGYWLYVLDELKLNGKDTVRIDDRIRNVEAAEKAGCYGKKNKNAAQRYSDIHSLD